MTDTDKIARLRKALAAAQAQSTKRSRARLALPPGASRARVTTANARWMRSAEHRDRIAAQLAEALAADGQVTQ